MRATWRTFVCGHVLTDGAPVRSVFYDGGGPDEEASLQADCGAPHPPGAAGWGVMAWGCLVQADPSLAEVDAMLSPDTWYTRTSAGAPWVVEPAGPDDEDDDEGDEDEGGSWGPEMIHPAP